MAEIVTLTAPETKPNNTHYTLTELHVYVSSGDIHARFIGDNGEIRDAIYGPATNPTGASLISTLNTSNNSTTSMVRRIYNRVIADGLFSGTVSGSPS